MLTRVWFGAKSCWFCDFVRLLISVPPRGATRPDGLGGGTATDSTTFSGIMFKQFHSLSCVFLPPTNFSISRLLTSKNARKCKFNKYLLNGLQVCKCESEILCVESSPPPAPAAKRIDSSTPLFCGASGGYAEREIALFCLETCAMTPRRVVAEVKNIFVFFLAAIFVHHRLFSPSPGVCVSRRTGREEDEEEGSRTLPQRKERELRPHPSSHPLPAPHPPTRRPAAPLSAPPPPPFLCCPHCSPGPLSGRTVHFRGGCPAQRLTRGQRCGFLPASEHPPPPPPLVDVCESTMAGYRGGVKHNSA